MYINCQLAQMQFVMKFLGFEFRFETFVIEKFIGVVVFGIDEEGLKCIVLRVSDVVGRLIHKAKLTLMFRIIFLCIQFSNNFFQL